MARIPLINKPDGLSPRQQEVLAAVVSGPRGKIEGPLMAALHNPDLADKWQQFGAMLRYTTCLPKRLSELAILVTARAWDAELEWHIHEKIAREVGVAVVVIEAIRTGRRPEAADQEALEIYDFVAELQRDKRVSPSSYDKVLTRWGVNGVVELTALTGYYSMVAMTLNAHEFPLPEGARPRLTPLSAVAS
jgi:4-carboxymuconolactone decarboxylase